MTAAGGEPAALPAGLREQVLAAALAARPAGRPVPEAAEISAIEAFSRSADAFYGLLYALGDRDWRAPTIRGLDVAGLVGHLTGVEEDMHRCLAGDPAVADVDHVQSTQPAAARQAGRPAAETRTEWRRAVDHTLALARASGNLEAGVAVYGMRLPLWALLVGRAFELWTHENDIRRAAGLPGSAPDASTLRLMTGLAARLLPQAAARTGLRDRIDLHLVLTGSGGGTWDVPVGQGPGERVSVGVVTDAVGFCRLAANRAVPGDLDLHITGDRGRALAVLAAAATLALD